MFNGIITPIVTPFRNDKTQSINYEATDLLIDHLINNGVSGIFPLGSNGEFTMLSTQERLDFAQHVINYVDHRVPVYVGTGACSTKEAIYLSQKSKKMGADALSIITPYFVKLSDEDIFNYYKEIAAAVNIPIILYNIPANTQNNISPQVLEALASLPNIAGIKDSSGNIELIDSYLKVVKKYPNLHFLIGSDSKISYAYQRGASGAIAGTSNLLTTTLVSLDKELRNQNNEKAKVLQESINPLRNVMHKAAVPSVLKRAVQLAKIAPVGDARRPETPPNHELNEEIIQMLKSYNLYNR